jgi:hypothetical protein
MTRFSHCRCHTWLSWHHLTHETRLYIWRFPEMGVTLNHPFEYDFPWNKPTIWGSSIYGNPPNILSHEPMGLTIKYRKIWDLWYPTSSFVLFISPVDGGWWRLKLLGTHKTSRVVRIDHWGLTSFQDRNVVPRCELDYVYTFQHVQVSCFNNVTKSGLL